MATSGTYSFNLTVEQIVTQAYEWVWGELTTGEDLRKARVSLQLLMIDMETRGHPLAEIENLTFTTSASVNSYDLPSNVIDVLDVVLTRDGLSTSINRIPLFEYHKVPNKTTTGKPSTFAISKDTTTATMYLYQAPENNTDTVDYWCITRKEDVGTNYQNTLDIDYRYLPAVTFGLAYFLSLGREGFDPNKRAEFLNNYITTLENAELDDRDRTSFQVTPWTYNRRR